MKKTTVEMHADCIELTSGRFRIAVTTQVGPRVIGAFIGDSDNLFRVMPPVPHKSGTGWKLYGGHRLWHSPEVMPRTYAPDNEPVTVSETEEGIEFSSGVEGMTGIEKSMLIESLGDETFKVTHVLTNRNQWTIEVAPWALSVMAQGGMAVLPQYRDLDANPFAPDRFVSFWPYSDPNDGRLTFGKRMVLLRQDPGASGPCKIGLNAEDGWIAYVNKGTAFVKFFEHYIDGQYPDNGCSVESYSCADFCEIETVAPLYVLEPDEAAEHVELWRAHDGLPAMRNEDDVVTHLLPLIDEE